MEIINVYPTTSVDTMAAAIAGVLVKKGEVELRGMGEGAIPKVFSGLGRAKECMNGYSVELVSAGVDNHSGSFVIRANRVI